MLCARTVQLWAASEERSLGSSHSTHQPSPTAPQKLFSPPSKIDPKPEVKRKNSQEALQVGQHRFEERTQLESWAVDKTKGEAKAEGQAEKSAHLHREWV